MLTYFCSAQRGVVWLYTVKKKVKIVLRRRRWWHERSKGVCTANNTEQRSSSSLPSLPIISTDEGATTSSKTQVCSAVGVLFLFICFVDKRGAFWCNRCEWLCVCFDGAEPMLALREVCLDVCHSPFALARIIHFGNNMAARMQGGTQTISSRFFSRFLLRIPSICFCLIERTSALLV